MSVYVDASSRLHHDQERSLALNCPHCQVFSHITAVSVPQYSELVASRPSQVGVVYRCDSCSAPIFLRFAVKMYAANRVELANNFVELERAREKFNFTYLPEDAEKLFREALGCYSAGHFNAFASMCRRTAQAVFQRPRRERPAADLQPDQRSTRDGGDRHRHVRGREEGAVRQRCRRVAVTAGDRAPTKPACCSNSSKDMLYQAYVRKGKLQQAMMVRRFFADETLDKITPIGRAARE